MTEIRIIHPTKGTVLETIKLKHEPVFYIMCRGRLLTRTLQFGGKFDYIERSYIEIS
jgi:hypothetical protein